MKLTIALFELEEWEKKAAKEALRGHTLLFFDAPLSEKDVPKLKNATAMVLFIYSKAPASILKQLPKLKLIATMSTGYDHIDIPYCSKHGITVCNVPTYGENTVAEHTFALILALSRKLYPSIKRTHEQHSFETDHFLRGFDLKGKTLGLVGCGNIGKHVARIGIGFEMNVLVYEPHPKPALAKELGFRYVSLPTIFKEANILTLHVPYNPATHHLFNAKRIRTMKLGSYLINTSRGGVVDTSALIEGLQSGKLAGAALDVLEGECEVKEESQVLKRQHKKECDLKTLLQDHLLMKMENVIVTPHNAFNSTEAIERILSTTLANVKSFALGTLQNTVGGVKKQ